MKDYYKHASAALFATVLAAAGITAACVVHGTENTAVASENGVGANEDMAAITALARLLYGEARGVDSKTERSAVVWCVLNRVDDEDFPDDVVGVVTEAWQFHGYDPVYPVEPELYALARDVMERWESEKAGEADVGRTLPAEYMWFTGDGETNTFTDAFGGGAVWDWSLDSPYED